MTHDREARELDSLARVLCDDAAARIIARQERAPSFEDSEADVQDYWRALARAALSTTQSSGQPTADQPAGNPDGGKV